MASGRGRKVEVRSERSKIPADGKTATKICLQFEEPVGDSITLKLTRRGSFEAGKEVREAEFPVRNGEVNLKVHAPSRPGTAFLTGEGFRHRIDFVAASFVQGLIFEWIPTLLWALGIALVLKSFVVASFYIPSGSMENTLLKRDLLIADKFTYKILQRDPQRGDIMIFQYPEDRKLDYIKRVIGVPGDEVKVRHGTVFINGEPLTEDYIKEKPLQSFGPVTVEPGEYFMMGDNRNHSQDSRVWGMVPRNHFEGRALFIFFPFNRVRLIQPGGSVMRHAHAATAGAEDREPRQDLSAD